MSPNPRKIVSRWLHASLDMDEHEYVWGLGANFGRNNPDRSYPSLTRELIRLYPKIVKDLRLEGHKPDAEDPMFQEILDIFEEGYRSGEKGAV